MLDPSPHFPNNANINTSSGIGSNPTRSANPTANMPPPTAYSSNQADEDGSSYSDGDALLREQDRLLPIANVARIMKMAVPTNAKIAKDAKETVQECVSEFIAFVTSEASDRCQQEKRKTINGEDILWAMESLGFDHYVQLLKIYLQKYKDVC